MARVEQGSVASKHLDQMFEGASLSVDRMPGLSAMLDQFQRCLADELAPLCGGKPSFDLGRMEAASLFEVLRQRQGNLAAILHCPQYDARMLVAFDRPFVDAFTYAVFGGSSAPAFNVRGTASSMRPFTEIELQLMARTATSAAGALGAAFADVTKVDFQFERLETIADVQMLGRRDANTITADIKFMIGDVSGGMLVVLTQPIVLPARPKFMLDPANEPAVADSGWAQQLRVGVESTRVTLTAVLEELESDLGHVATFTVGHMLELKGRGMGRVMLECSGQDLFWCKLGQSDGGYTLVIEEPVAHANTFESLVQG
jgi:flagellar motor switch protein FliM